MLHLLGGGCIVLSRVECCCLSQRWCFDSSCWQEDKKRRDLLTCRPVHTEEQNGRLVSSSHIRKRSHFLHSGIWLMLTSMQPGPAWHMLRIEWGDREIRMPFTKTCKKYECPSLVWWRSFTPLTARENSFNDIKILFWKISSNVKDGLF